MKLAKVLLLIIVFEIIAGIYVFNMDTDEYYNYIFKEASYDNKHEIKLSEISHKDYKKIRVNFHFIKEDGKWTYLEYMSFECNKKKQGLKIRF